MRDGADPMRAVVFRRDVASAVLGFAPRVALSSLLPFLAVNRLGASMAWVGVLNAAIYTGFLWNAFFSTLTARMSLQRSIVVLMAGSAALLAAAAFQRAALPYCLLVVLVLFAGGLMNAQYDTFLVHLYDEAERPKRLSLRWLAVSCGAAAMAPLFGALSEGPSGFWPALTLASAVLMAGAVLFLRIPARGTGAMEPFGLARMVRAVLGDRRFLRLVLLLVLYGWMGAGFGTIDVALYRLYGCSESAVGLLSAAMTAGMIFAAFAVTPFLRFRGGAGNFRLCFTASTAAALLLGAAGLMAPGPWGIACIGAGNLLYGISATGFTIGAQTAAVNLAAGRNVALYVNAFKFFQGVRGIVFPLLVAWAIQAAPIGMTLAIAFLLTLVSAVVSWIPAADRD